MVTLQPPPSPWWPPLPAWKPVYARKLFDISWRSVAFAIGAALRPNNDDRERAASDQLERVWAPSMTLPALSVRSAFDLLLQACDFPRGSELIMSGVTIPDMVRIVLAHGLIPVPLDIEEDAGVSATKLRSLITPKTKILVVAHLFGGYRSIDDLAKQAHEHGIMVVEDCAQAFRGDNFTGSPSATVSMFSFGPIKTCTALGGALVTIRDPGLLSRLQMIQSRYRQQTSGGYLKRVLKYAVFKIITDRPNLYGLLIKCAQMLAGDYDRIITRLSHSFAGDADLLPQLRLRPSTALLETLAQCISSFNPERLARRTLLVESLAGRCPMQRWPVGLMGGESRRNHHYWICPVRVDDPHDMQKTSGSGL